MLVILLLFLTLFLIYTVIEQRTSKIRQIKNSTVVLVKNAQLNYPGLPLKNYAIPLTVRHQNRVQVVFPRLTPDGDVEYIYSWHSLKDIEVIEQIRDLKLIHIKKLASIVQEHWQMEPEIATITAKYRKIEELANLVSTSRVYVGQIETYERALAQLEKMLKKAKQLQKIYVCLIKEALIGVQIAEYDPESLEVSQETLDLQYQRLKEEYETMKDVAQAYTQLLREGRSTEC